MRLVAEWLLVLLMPLVAYSLRGSSTLLSMAVLSAFGIGLVILLSVSHHHERQKLDWRKLAEYIVFTLFVIGSYLLLI